MNIIKNGISYLYPYNGSKTNEYKKSYEQIEHPFSGISHPGKINRAWLSSFQDNMSIDDISLTIIFNEDKEIRIIDLIDEIQFASSKEENCMIVDTIYGENIETLQNLYDQKTLYVRTPMHHFMCIDLPFDMFTGINSYKLDSTLNYLIDIKFKNYDIHNISIKDIYLRVDYVINSIPCMSFLKTQREVVNLYEQYGGDNNNDQIGINLEFIGQPKLIYFYIFNNVYQSPTYLIKSVRFIIQGFDYVQPYQLHDLWCTSYKILGKYDVFCIPFVSSKDLKGHKLQTNDANNINVTKLEQKLILTINRDKMVDNLMLHVFCLGF